MADKSPREKGYREGGVFRGKIEQMFKNGFP